MVIKMKSIDFLIFGRIPPPIGGVTVSVKNLIEALNANDKTYDLLSIWCLFRRYTVAHVNYSRIWKIFVAGVLSKILSDKSVFVIHGNDFDFNSRFNIFTLKLYDGVIGLNEQVSAKLSANNINNITLSPIFDIKHHEKVDAVDVISKKDGFKYVLIYINDLMIVQGIEVYGADFFSKTLKHFPDFIIPVVVDVSGKFEYLFSKGIESNIIYFNHPVDFVTLLKQVDLYVRPTANDGSSVAVLESLMVGTPVLASDAVDRPQGVNLYTFNDSKDFISKVKCLLDRPVLNRNKNLSLSKISELFEFIDKS